MPRKSIENDDPNNTETADAPSIMPPAGVDAKVKTTVEYQRRIDPGDANERYSLEDLAAEEAANLSPPDPLARFLEEWGQYAGYNCEIVRLPDAADKRMPGNHYARPNFSEIERLGGMPFDPLNLVPTLQMINGYSGGAFRIWLTDQAGQIIPSARLDRFAIADPPGSAGRNQNPDRPAGQPAYGYAPAPPQERQPSLTEKKMADLQTRLLENALDRALNSPPAIPPQSSPISSEDQLTLLLVKEGGLLRTVTDRLVGLVQTPDAIERATWKDKLVDLAIQNPTLVARVNDTIDRVATRFFGGPAIPTPSPQLPSEYTSPQPSASNLPSEVPDDSQEDDDDMAIIDELLALLSDTKPLQANNPTFIQLRKDYPARFPVFNQMLAQTPLEMIYEIVSAQSNLYRALLSSPVAGPHLRKRIAELQALCIEALKATPTPETSTASE